MIVKTFISNIGNERKRKLTGKRTRLRISFLSTAIQMRLEANSVLQISKQVICSVKLSIWLGGVVDLIFFVNITSIIFLFKQKINQNGSTNLANKN